MNIQHLLPIGLCLACIWPACNKGKPRQYSYWKAGKQEYASNNVKLTKGKAISQFFILDPTERVFLEFFMTGLPNNGQYLIVKDNPLQQDDRCVLSFTIDSRWYQVAASEQKYVQASMGEHGAVITMPPTWYINHNDPTDSILIEGTFNEP